MSERLKTRIAVVLMLAMAIALVLIVAGNENPQDRVERIGSSIKCPVCQGESIADSPAPMATDMMDLIRDRVDGGSSDEEIVDELLASFSGAILLDPPASGVTLWLWLAPAAVLAVGMAVVLWWRVHPGKDPGVEGTPPTRRRRIAGGLILVGAFAVTVVLAVTLLQDRATPAEGAANVDVENLDDVSNETMEAVVAANSDNPQISGMRLALAERYFDAGDYRSAFPHYLAVAEGATSSPEEVTTSLIRLGWMAFDGNGEVATALTLLDQALEISPESQAALYVKGQVLWCGSSDFSGAAGLFRGILDDPNLPEATRDQVSNDLEKVDAGETCA